MKSRAPLVMMEQLVMVLSLPWLPPSASGSLLFRTAFRWKTRPGTGR